MAAKNVDEREARFYAQLATQIQKAREEAGMSQAEVAKTLGMSATGYGHYERDMNHVSLWLLVEIARIFDKPLEYFLPSEYLFASQKAGSALRLDEQALIAAYRKLDGLMSQAPVFTTFLETCRVWSEAGIQSTPVDGGASTPMIVARQNEDGKLEIIAEGTVLSEVAAKAPALVEAQAQEFAQYMAQIEHDPALREKMSRFLVDLLAVTVRGPVS